MQQQIEYIKQAFELKNQKSYKQAIELFYKALETENDNPEILYQLGELYYLLKNYSRALSYLERLLIKEPSHVDCLKLLKSVYIFLGQFNSAFYCAQKVFELQSNSENLAHQVKTAVLVKNYEVIYNAASLDIADDNVLYECAKAFYDKRDFEAANNAIEKALEINPENKNILILLGKMFFDKNEFDKSKEIFKRFPKTTDNPEILNYFGLFALEDLKFIDAIKYFSKASSIDKNHKYFFNLGNAYFYNGWIAEAIKAYKQAICLSPDIMDYRYALAYLYYDEKQFEKAQKEIDYIFSVNKNHFQAKILDSLLKFEQKEFIGAQKQLEENLRISPDNTFTLVSLAKVYSELGLYVKAEKLMLKVCESNPESLNYKSLFVEVLIKQKRYEQALEIIQELIEKNENYIISYVHAAQIYCEMKEFEKAKIYAQNAIFLDINYAPGYYYLALARFYQSDYEEAVECMKRAIIYDVNNAAYYAKMSEIYKGTGDIKTALNYAKEAESIDAKTEYRILYSELAALKRKIK